MFRTNIAKKKTPGKIHPFNPFFLSQQFNSKLWLNNDHITLTCYSVGIKPKPSGTSTVEAAYSVLTAATTAVIRISLTFIYICNNHI